MSRAGLSILNSGTAGMPATPGGGYARRTFKPLISGGDGKTGFSWFTGLATATSDGSGIIQSSQLRGGQIVGTNTGGNGAAFSTRTAPPALDVTRPYRLSGLFSEYTSILYVVGLRLECRSGGLGGDVRGVLVRYYWNNGTPQVICSYDDASQGQSNSGTVALLTDPDATHVNYFTMRVEVNASRQLHVWLNDVPVLDATGKLFSYQLQAADVTKKNVGHSLQWNGAAFTELWSAGNLALSQ